jgi:hypothetical protein
MAEKKKQHYVPQMILRRFSPNGKNIGALLLRSGKPIPSIGLREQCYENYFYGKDGIMEEGFAEGEGMFSGMLGDLSESHLGNLDADALTHFRIFIVYQYMRTKKAASITADMAEDALKEHLRPMVEAKGIDLDDLRIGLINPQSLNLASATFGVASVMDLAVKFIVTDRKTGFVLADHPTVVYNQFAEHHPVLSDCLGASGLLSKGIQILFPVSPTTCVVMYDPTTYECGSPNSYILRAGRHDTQAINTLQAISADECLYYNPQFMDGAELERLMAVRRRFAQRTAHKLIRGERYAHEDGTERQPSAISPVDTRAGIKFGFCRVTDLEQYQSHHDIAMPHRDTGITEFQRGWAEFVREQSQRSEPVQTDSPIAAENG